MIGKDLGRPSSLTAELLSTPLLWWTSRVARRYEPMKMEFSSSSLTRSQMLGRSSQKGEAR